MNPASQYGGHAYYFLLAVLQEKHIEIMDLPFMPQKIEI
jgi:hypothetical protein